MYQRGYGFLNTVELKGGENRVWRLAGEWIFPFWRGRAGGIGLFGPIPSRDDKVQTGIDTARRQTRRLQPLQKGKVSVS